MNAGARTPSRFAKADSEAGRATAMVVGIDDLLVRSTANFNRRMDALEKLLTSNRRDQAIGLISLVATLLIGFTGVICALVR